MLSHPVSATPWGSPGTRWLSQPSWQGGSAGISVLEAKVAPSSPAPAGSPSWRGGFDEAN